ncbi:NELL2-interacting cell ontogeny regulator 1 [Eulemur rufifrons]|uniref:NELL2-interacting cell ontogeny regulator 1 n=1 Tax=Eulemur rufifrons TaxID=859984 RepID=UPI003744A1EE
MAPPPARRSPMSMLPPLPLPLLLLLLSLALLGTRARAEPATGSAVPAQSRPCVDCHAFEFMQRALQDLRKTAYSLDARTETLLLQAERRALCACWPTGR